jgi:hypothetical protein
MPLTICGSLLPLWRLDILRPTGAEESGIRREMGPKLTFHWQKVNETRDSSSMV